MINNTDVPDSIIQANTGDVALDRRGDRIEGLSALADDTLVRARNLLNQAEEKKGPDSRIVTQWLRIKEVVLQEVRYRYQDSGSRALWIIGTAGQVYAPKGPVAWRRVATVSVAALLGLLLFLILIGHHH